MTGLKRLVEAAPGVWVATSRRYGTTSTVILDGHGGALVVDPTWDPDELAAIPADLAVLGVRCVAGLSTHVHYDHVMWHPDLGDVPRWTTQGTVAMVEADREKVVAPLVGDLPDDLVDVAARGLAPILGERLEWSGPTAYVHVHHAHAPHHLALELPDLGVLVAGDMLSDIELPMPDDADVDLATYRAGLESLEDVVRRSRVLVPGHGTVGDRPLDRWAQDVRYLDDLERTGASDDPRVQLDGMADLHEANLRRAASIR
jgi:glyoxylase-like metal-dependent hydrolase (beta-lactamase superfamily II)